MKAIIILMLCDQPIDERCVCLKETSRLSSLFASIDGQSVKMLLTFTSNQYVIEELEKF